MDLIFHNGEKLYTKEKDIRKQAITLLEECGCIHVNHYQKQVLDIMFDQNKKDFNIFGDDFKVEIVPVNVAGNCCLSIKDYDGKQRFEHEINIDFTKNELDQFINLLQIAKNKMK